MWGQTLSIPSAPERICVLRLSAIGDVCHAVATVQQIQRQRPEAKITWVVGKTEHTLLDGLKGVELVVFDKQAGMRGLWALRRAMRGRHFDVLLHMQSSLRASLASCCISATVRLGFDKARAKEAQWLFTNAWVLPQDHPHVVEGFQAFAQALGLAPEPPQWDMPVFPEHEAWVLKRLRSAKPYVVICPSASKCERNWLPERYALTAEFLVSRGYRVVICGSAEAAERKLADHIKTLCKCALIDMVGETDLKQLLAVLKHAHLLVSPDTGPAHMAVTVGTPVVGLYAHSNPRRTGPYYYRDYVVSVYDAAVQEQYGKAWHLLPAGKRAMGAGLMKRIDVTHVMRTIERLLILHYPEVG